MDLSEYIDEVKIYVGRSPEYILVNNGAIPSDILSKYEAEGDSPVKDDLANDPSIVRGDFLATKLIKRKRGDVLTRSLIRHDGAKLAKALLSLIE